MDDLRNHDKDDGCYQRKISICRIIENSTSSNSVDDNPTNTCYSIHQDDDFAAVVSKAVSSDDHRSHSQSWSQVRDDSRSSISEKVEDNDGQKTVPPSKIPE